MSNWDLINNSIIQAGPLAPLTLDEVSWNELAKALGLMTIPRSYRQFVEIYGAGFFGVETHLLPPVVLGGHHSLATFAEHEWPEYSTGLPNRFDYVIFALIPCECYLAWQKCEVNDDELPIFVIDAEYNEVIYASGSLDEFLVKHWIRGGINSIFPLNDQEWNTSLSFNAIR